MKNPRLVWDSKNEPQSTKPVSAFDRVRVVKVDPNDAELPPGTAIYVTERWNGTSAMGEDQWRDLSANLAPPPEIVRALARLADAEAAAKDLAGKLGEEGLDAVYLAKEAEFLARTRDYYRRIASAKPFEELRDPGFFKVASQWSDEAWATRSRREDKGNPFADEPTAFADVPDASEELPPVLETESPPEPTAHVETDERTDDEIPH